MTLLRVHGDMKDYYEILGVEEEASGEEIRAHWIELTKRYHPDLGRTEEGDEKIKEINEAYEILKDDLTRFNYDFERDLKRSFVKKAHRRQVRRMNIQKIIIPSGILVLFLIVGFILLRSGPVGTPPRTGAKTAVLDTIEKIPKKKTASQTPPARTDLKAQDESRVPRETKKEVTPLESKEVVSPDRPREASSSKAGKEAGLRVNLEQAPGLKAGESKGSLPPPRSPVTAERESDQKKEPSRKILPESKLPVRVEKEIPKPIRKEIPQERTRVVSAPLPPPAKKESEPKEKLAPQVVMKSQTLAVKEVSKEVPREIPKETPKEVLREVPREVPKQVAKEIPKEAPKEILKEPPKEAPKEVAKVISQEASKEIPKQAPKEALQEVPKEVPKQVAKEVPKQVPKEAIKVTLHPGERLTMWTKEERTVPLSPPLLAKEEEVRQFFSNYIDRYHRKDVSGFLSLFSSKAIQNQTDGLEAIGNLYTKFVNQSQELRYQIEGMKIDISQYRVDVKARFRIDQKLKESGEEKVWKGNIRWVLVREGERLKISSLDYQNEKSP